MSVIGPEDGLALAQLQDSARRRGKRTADALDDVRADDLEWQLLRQGEFDWSIAY